MNFSTAAGRCLALALAGLCLTGCPAGNGTLVEQKDPHFLTGQNRVNSMDYKGAIESFEQALETNPRSASAHFELALLYEQKENNPAAAIYHYERFLQLRPDSDRADVVKPRITACKQELAKSFLLTPGGLTAQRELEKMKLEMERLAAENAQLRHQLEAAGAAVPRPAVTATNVARISYPPAADNSAAKTTTPTKAADSKAAPAADTKAKTTAVLGTHTVKQGDTPASVARKYGVRPEALMAANPGLDPKKLKIGQILNIPAP